MEKVDADTTRIVQGLHNHISRLSIQIECSRLLQQIEADLRELRANAMEARLAKASDVGYMPAQTIEGDGVFEISTDENEARFSVIRTFTDIEKGLDSLTEYLPGYEGNMNDLAIELELFRTNVREEARKSARRSLYGIAFSGYLLNKFNNKMTRWLIADDDGRKRIIESRDRNEE
jgi:hypothetical protein